MTKDGHNMMQLFYQDTNMFAMIVEKMSKFQSQLIEQQKEITLLRGDATTKDKTIAMLQKSLDEEKIKNDDINQLVVTSLSPSLTLVKEVIEKHQDKIDFLSNNMAISKAAKEAMETKIDSNTQSIQNLRDNITESIESISQLDERYTSQLTNVSGNLSKGMIAQMDSMSQDLEKLKMREEGNEKTIESITDTLTGHSENLTEINVLLGNQKTSVEVQDSKLKSLNDLVDTLNKAHDTNQTNLVEAQELQKQNMTTMIQSLKQEILLKLEQAKGDSDKMKASFATHDYVDDKMKRFLHDELDTVSRKSGADVDIENMRRLFTPLDQFHKQSLEFNTKLEEMKQSILSHSKFDDIKNVALDYTKQEIDSLRDLQNKQLKENLDLYKKEHDTTYVSVKDFDSHMQYCEETYLKQVNQTLLVSQDQLNKKVEELTKFMKENYMNSLKSTPVTSENDQSEQGSSAKMTIFSQQIENINSQITDMNDIMAQWQERIQQNYEDIGDSKGAIEALREDFDKFKQDQLTLNVEGKAHFEKLDETNDEQEKRWNEFHNFHWRFVDKKVTRIDKDIKRHDDDIEKLYELSDKIQEINVDIEHLEKTLGAVDSRHTNSVKTMNNNFRSINDTINRLRDHINNQPMTRAVSPISLHTDSSPHIVLEPPVDNHSKMEEPEVDNSNATLSVKQDESEDDEEDDENVDESTLVNSPEGLDEPKVEDDEDDEDDEGDEDEEHELEVIRLSSHHWFKKGPNLIVDDTVPNHVFRQGGANEWQSAHTRESYAKGAYIWTVKISDIKDDAKGLIGVADPSKLNLDKDSIGSVESSWALSIPDCKLHHNGQILPFEGINSIESGSSIYIFLNIDDGTLSFARERNDLGNEENIAFDDIHGKLSPSVSIGKDGVCSFVFV